MIWQSLLYEDNKSIIKGQINILVIIFLFKFPFNFYILKIIKTFFFIIILQSYPYFFFTFTKISFNNILEDIKEKKKVNLISLENKINK